MDKKEEVFYFFRKLVYALYLEIGALQPYIHPEIASKADINNAFFKGERKRQAVDLFSQIESETSPAKVIAPYQERTGLALEDIHRAFVEGKWRSKHGGYYFGGPRWARIAEITLELRLRIEQEEWDRAEDLLYDIKRLKTNQGFLVHLFEWTERGRI